ncbi:Imm27 family immunity protein [Sediminibacterium goheungense]|uniref:Immunity protein 27 of polymorphic toxin system n=1 Tax=Sediminibacterium goheungense TaxID=1086393 RepID=A0A4V3C576_9BACT|nr:Imm27 family immunity protein [Sediminibacterium goheungense]TDO28798.1 immunity protein 27 of polymorphic toxin system [Sediminibacterium goheungense]
MQLQKSETHLSGQWIFEAGVMKEDEVAIRIKWLINNSLKMICNDSTGWKTLYQDLSDGRYWEHTYGQSEMHGGGPSELIHLTDQEAQLKYRLV